MNSKKRKIFKGVVGGVLALVIIGGGIFSYQMGKSVGGGMLEVEKEQDTYYNSII